MGKVKLNLVSGAIVEKPLISAFSANGSSYVVLDNEMNGSMGLPIILVCKYLDNKLIKIEDPNEWQIVKEYLKNIIAGNQVEFISVPAEIAADDIYYTQLTLPVPSFDALKSSYNVGESSIELTPEVPVDNATPSAPFEAQSSTPVAEPVIPEEPAVDPIAQVSSELAAINPEVPDPTSPVVDISVAPSEAPIENVTSSEPSPSVTSPIPEAPISNVEPVIPQVETPVADSTVEEAANVTPADMVGINDIVPSPATEPEAPVGDTQASETSTDATEVFKDQKEAFMQACENMVDALIQKFAKELEKRN